MLGFNPSPQSVNELGPNYLVTSDILFLRGCAMDSNVLVRRSLSPCGFVNSLLIPWRNIYLIEKMRVRDY